MNKISVGALAVCLLMTNQAFARGLAFSIYHVQDRPLFEIAKEESKALDKALDIHNLMLDIGLLDGVNRQQAYAVKFKKSQQKKMINFEACSLKKMQKSSQNAKSEWEKKKEAYRQGKETAGMEEFAKQEQALAGTEEFENMIVSEGNRRVVSVKGKIAKYIQMDDKADLMQASVRQDVIKKLQTVYDEALKEAEEELAKRSDNPDAQYQKDEKLLLALKSDRNGEVYFTKTNAGSFDQLKADTQMKAKMMNGFDQLEKMLDQEMNTDDGCSDGV